MGTRIPHSILVHNIEIKILFLKLTIVVNLYFNSISEIDNCREFVF